MYVKFVNPSFVKVARLSNLFFILCKSACYYAHWNNKIYALVCKIIFCPEIASSKTNIHRNLNQNSERNSALSVMKNKQILDNR